MASIRYIAKKLKSIILEDRYFVCLSVILLIILAFRIGQLSASDITPFFPKQDSGDVILLDQPKVKANDALTVPYNENNSDLLVASREGTRYYPVKCSYHKRINKENRIYFTSEEKARAGGYSRAKNCF